mmetsp:Transcript_50440/g.132868  ORF Transcript_50440/g.132868 Transcript_50440/m.132868 type:complete len:207 (+) Transcript_50440:366-986(+)
MHCKTASPSQNMGTSATSCTAHPGMTPRRAPWLSACTATIESPSRSRPAASEDLKTNLLDSMRMHLSQPWNTSLLLAAGVGSANAKYLRYRFRCARDLTRPSCSSSPLEAIRCRLPSSITIDCPPSRSSRSHGDSGSDPLVHPPSSPNSRTTARASRCGPSVPRNLQVGGSMVSSAEFRSAGKAGVGAGGPQPSKMEDMKENTPIS